MKTKTSSKRIALLGSALLALSIFAPAVVEAELMLSLDNPNQTVVRPSSGTTVVDIAGTIIVEPGFAFNPPGAVIVDQPFNASGTDFLAGVLNDAFVAFVTDHTGIFTGGTFTGTIASFDVTSVTPVDLYAFVGGAT
jgi:hypothetical protein